MWSKAIEAIKSSSKSSSIYIGCDSLVSESKGKRTATYSTVVILHIDSNKGCKVFHNNTKITDHNILSVRLLTEVQYALEAYHAIQDVIDGRKLEIHIDVNSDPIHASNCVTNQAIGWVRSLGLEAKIKPYSFAASSAADHCVRHLN